MSLKTQITLRTAVVLPFVMIFLFTMGVMVFTQKQSYKEMVSDVSARQLTSLTDSVHQSLSNFLEKPFHANLSLSHNIGYHDLYRSGNLSKVQNYILYTFSDHFTAIPQLDVIGFGSEDGDYVGFRKEANKGYTLMVQDERTNDQLVIYRDSEISEDIRSVISGYDPRVRPWYTPVATQKKAAWSTIYANADERQDITLSALAPIYDDNQFKAVIVSDIKINTFNAFLRKLKDRTDASVYIIDKQQRLVAHSGGGSVVSWGTGRTNKGQRLLATESANPVIRESASYVDQFHLIDNFGEERFSFLLDNERYFNQITPYEDEHGLTWFIGVSIPESNLLGELPENQRNSWLLGLALSCIGVIAGLFAFNRVTQPITSTADAAKRLAKGDWDTSMPKTGHIYETSMLVASFNEMTNNLKASFHALQSQLTYDSLTKLYSREGFIDAAKKHPNNENGTLYLIGIDRFRDINDSLGHYNGDQLLIIAAARLRGTLPSEYLLARTGGDEFAIYAPNVTQSSDVQLLTNRLLQTFASPFPMESESVVIKVSMGIVDVSNLDDITLLLRSSSIALSNAKQDKTSVSTYSPEMGKASRHRTKMLARMNRAIDLQQFEPFYQPIIDLESGSTIGAEALARWITDEGVISPLEFIPLAEESGLIYDIGKQILYKSCRDTAIAIESGKWSKDFSIHVNLSVDQLSESGFVEQVKGTLRDTKLPASNLTLEITESRIVDNDPTIIDNMLTLKALGVSIAIDDFGTGYSSLAYLQKLPFDCLKIDRSFVSKLEKENLDSSIVAAIVNITMGFKVSLVAEGVETQQQAELLKQLQCPLAQGFLYSRPVPFDQWPTDLINVKQNTKVKESVI
ncbi:EAL domain-containing protein [Vibrio sp. 10N.261.46.E12]|uniref:GGDEF and EAL domain-containing protein n=1 Tax=unclassified Vibrio TaxID=2614977 RepID=UPI00097832EF|nr:MULTISPECIES: GGDEF and EAL domain-containing protein [unclassified Vibrio]OMO37566.1 diguanylate cyclase [Vibrio sp. 10N.261.45.E1]PMJ37139.1 diguanylate cyclase [Vibrio sp. 10N.286.45.B6]PML86637.1 diguanylate cyclase [Vibrio sp. 10N.261.49.E11]PMM72743.1 diguanylate cyclase [Vibrio sp. 10N.261.46.F12]PMM82584.1 diguanylate cyclase [Vibrio sp. 10N.261.46.E8]